MKSPYVAAWVLAIAGVVLSAQPPAPYAPARYQAGQVPPLPALAVGGGEVLVELDVARTGQVTAVTPLRTTPPFTTFMQDAVRGWQFKPAEATVESGGQRSRVAVASKVLVAGMFRAPVLIGPTLGEPPKDVARGSSESAFPTATILPGYPPNAVGGGVVLVEAHLEADGSLAGASVVRTAPPFDEPALTATRQWRFRSARVGGTAVPAFVYIVFGFPVPVGISGGAPKLSSF